jgi:hypothetical protein
MKMLLNKVKQKQRKQKYVAAVLYRIPIPVTKILVFLHGDSYPVCPRCDCTVDREYMRFCDRCGQRLGWKRIDRAEIIYAPCKENR